MNRNITIVIIHPIYGFVRKIEYSEEGCQGEKIWNNIFPLQMRRELREREREREREEPDYKEISIG